MHVHLFFYRKYHGFGLSPQWCTGRTPILALLPRNKMQLINCMNQNAGAKKHVYAKLRPLGDSTATDEMRLGIAGVDEPLVCAVSAGGGDVGTCLEGKQRGERGHSSTRNRPNDARENVCSNPAQRIFPE